MAHFGLRYFAQLHSKYKGDEFYVPVKASEATINVMCRDNFHFIGLFTSDPRKFRVSIYRNTVLYWRGFVVADLYSESGYLALVEPLYCPAVSLVLLPYR